MLNDDLNIIECPRDAIQGLKNLISTEKKIAYINKLIDSALFEYIDFGSFVSPKAVPQMSDTAEVLKGIDLINSTKLLAIIANEKGAELANRQPKITYLGYPFSISETFQLRNTNSTIQDSFLRVKNIVNIISNTSQELVIYISMAFGNPYHDEWSLDRVLFWVDKISQLGVKRFSIADTTSEATPYLINKLFIKLNEKFPLLDFSIHLHSSISTSLSKINAAYDAGCRRFEGALLGYGGCPFAKDDLIGNVPTELLLQTFKSPNEVLINKLIIDFQNLITDDRL